jgi:hypothetical protein
MRLFTMYQGLQSNTLCQQLVSCIIFPVEHRISPPMKLVAGYSLLVADSFDVGRSVFVL